MFQYRILLSTFRSALVHTIVTKHSLLFMKLRVIQLREKRYYYAGVNEIVFYENIYVDLLFLETSNLTLSVNEYTKTNSTFA